MRVEASDWTPASANETKPTSSIIPPSSKQTEQHCPKSNEQKRSLATKKGEFVLAAWNVLEEIGKGGEYIPDDATIEKLLERAEGITKNAIQIWSKSMREDEQPPIKDPTPPCSSTWMVKFFKGTA